MGLLGLFVSVELGVHFRPVAQLAEQRSPKPQVGGSIPSWPASEWQGRMAGDTETKILGEPKRWRI